MGDAPADSVLAFELTINKVTLTPQNGSAQVVLSTATEIEFQHLAGEVELLTLGNIPSGTYTKASISWSNPEITFIPNTAAGSPPAAPVEKQCSLSGTVDISPTGGFTLGSGTTVLNFDLPISQSLTFNATGTDVACDSTGIHPVFTLVTNSMAAEDQQEEETGEVDDAVGVVTAVQPSANPPTFTITLEMSMQSQTFAVNSNTVFQDGLTSINDIKMGMLLEVEAVTQMGTNTLLARKVELEETQGTEAEGVVISIASAPTQQFTIVDEDGAGPGITTANVGGNITVNVGAGTVFKANLDKADMSGLTFMFSSFLSLAKGQNVEVESSAGMQGNSTINADKVILVRQALTGAVTNYTPNASGGGATFSLNLPAESAFFKLTNVAQIKVYQQPKTQLNGLTSISNGATVRVRGLLFFDGTNYQFVAVRITTP